MQSCSCGMKQLDKAGNGLFGEFLVKDVLKVFDKQMRKV